MGRASDQVAIFEDHVSDEEFNEESQLVRRHASLSVDDGINQVGSSPGYCMELEHGDDENRYLIAGDTTVLSIEEGDELDTAFPDDEDLYDHRSHMSEKQARKVSDAVSAIPEELEYYKSTLPGRSPLSLSKSHLESPSARSRTSQHREYLGTPPIMPMLHSPTHSRSNSALRQDARPAFRNPSSVRAMQLSSPTPRSGSPSPRLRRHTRNQTADQVGDRSHSSLRQHDHITQSRSGTPSRQTLSRHPNPKKEYPLVLLHCTVSVLALPATFPQEAFAATGMSEKAIQDVNLLNQKMNATVLERGILIQHPGDDYELLRERVLENLDLRRPRVGACGHFRSTSPSMDDDEPRKHTLSNAHDEETQHDGECRRCDDCARHVCTDIMSDEERDALRHWDVRIYAANGLMRAGAWSAAWREMEKVDVEIGVWVSNEIRSKLDAWSLEREKEREQQEMFDMQEEAAGYAEGYHYNPRSAETHSRANVAASGFKEHERFSATTNGHSPASRAATSRPDSRHKVPFEPLHHTQGTTRPDTEPFANSEEPWRPTEETPLTTLLFNYVSRGVDSHKEVLLAIVVILLGTLFVGCSLFGSNISSTTQPSTSHVDSVSGSLFGSFDSTDASAKARVSADIDAIVERVQLAACTFAPSALESGGPQAEMTALPRDNAHQALRNLIRKEAVIKEEASSESEVTDDSNHENSGESKDGSGGQPESEETDGGLMATVNTLVGAVVDDGDFGEAVE